MPCLLWLAITAWRNQAVPAALNPSFGLIEMHHKIIPQVAGQYLLGNIRQLKAGSLQAFCDWRGEYGDLLGFSLAHRHFYLVSHPALIEQAFVKQNEAFVKMYDPQKPNGLSLVLGQGLVTSRGDLWLRQRRLMQPVFQRGNLTVLLPEMITAGENMLSKWRRLGDGAQVNLAEEMMQLTLEVITQTMFGVSVLDKVADIAPALDTLLRYAANSLINPFRPPLWLPTSANRKFNAALALLDAVIYGIIDQRRAQSIRHNDLLDMLLHAGDGDGEKMSDRQIRDEVITIFSAGHETTSNLLTWTLYLLARTPDVLAKLRQEQDAYLPDGAPAPEHLQQMAYSKAVLNEALRVRPPVGAMLRRVARDTEVDGYLFKQGRLAIFSIYNIHHHPDFWPQPERFDPERFMNADKRGCAFVPFGMGERICIGNNFALLESQALLSMITRRFDLQLPSDKEAEVEMAVSLKPKGGIPVRLKQRR